jgi:hypothetical protein
LGSVFRYMACLIAVAASFGISLLVFSPRGERPTAVADGAETPARALLACATPAGHDCLPGLPGRDIEVMTPPGTPSPVTADAAPAAKPADQPAPGKQPATAFAQEPAPAPAATAAPAPAAAPAAVAPAPTQQAATPPTHPQRRPATAEVVKPEREPVVKRTARREPAAKRQASEALRSVRRFGDDLRDIPVSSYAADGSRRNIVIRPTNIQDVYYYSVPR